MQISPKYNPQETENKWYAHWMEKGNCSFANRIDKNQYLIYLTITPATKRPI